MTTNQCPSCGGPAVRQAFPTTTAYVTCRNGHVFPISEEE